MKKIPVRFSVVYETIIEVPDNATEEEIIELMTDIDIPLQKGYYYVDNSFTPIKQFEEKRKNARK